MIHFRSLQSLRGIAALLVVYFHAVLQIRFALGRPQTSLPVFGAAGVDLFFVLSGFVMWTSTAGRDLSPLGFYKRRLVRIVPLYWIVTLAACLIALLLPQLLRSTVFTFEHALTSFLFLPWPNPGLPSTSPDLLSPVVIPGWTLNYEMFFYLLFGCTLLVPQQNRPTAVAGLIGLTLIAAHFLSPLVPNLHFYANSMMLEFLAGIVIAAAIARWQLPFPRFWPAAVLILLVALCWVEALDLQVDRVLRLGILAALIILGAAAAERAETAPRAVLLEHIGDASYSVYLVHVFVIAALRGVTKAFEIQIVGAGGELLFLAAALIGSVTVGMLVHRLVELPSTRFTSRLLMKPRRDGRPLAVMIP